jgi:histidyl-tRNA synthetase
MIKEKRASAKETYQNEMAMRKLSTQPYKGTRDFLPEEMSVRNQIFQTLFHTVELFGFRRYDGPILESAAIYEAKSGEEIANQQLYRLTDKGGRELALRPEMTPSVARIIAGNADKTLFPARWYCNVNCHRYERPQRGRVREHWQLNVDIFGSESAEAEVEIFDLVAALMSALGATQEIYSLRVNDRILVEAALRNYVGLPDQMLLDVGMVIDRW